MGLSGAYLLTRLGYDLRHAIEYRLAVDWLGSPYVIGATLESLPLNGGGAFGVHGQGVYAFKAFIGALKHELSNFTLDDRVGVAGTIDDEIAEAHGRIILWWSIIKGFTFSMLSTELGTNLADALLDHPGLIEDLKEVLERGQRIGAMQLGRPSIPVWGRLRSELDYAISNTTTPDLLARLDERIANERNNRKIQAEFFAR